MHEQRLGILLGRIDWSFAGCEHEMLTHTGSREDQHHNLIEAWT